MIDFLKGKITPKDWVAVALILGVTASIVVAFYMMVHKEQLVEIELQTQTNENVQVDLDKAREIDQNIEDYIKETDQIRVLVQQFEDRLPSRRELTNLIKEFEDMATSENVKLDTAPMKKSIQGSKETIPYKIEVTGNFHQVASFINRLERFERYLKITDLKMSPNKDGESKFNFTLNTYRFLQPTELDK